MQLKIKMMKKHKSRLKTKIMKGSIGQLQMQFSPAYRNSLNLIMLMGGLRITTAKKTTKVYQLQITLKEHTGNEILIINNKLKTMDETIDLVMSLTGAKYSRKAITSALEQCEGDADEAIEYLITQSRTEMFSAKTIAKEPKKEIK
jgi:NACalpha-BTF3-like transcription factor